MITTLLTEIGLTGMHVDNTRSMIWLSRDDGLVLSVDPAGVTTKHQQLNARPVDIAGSKTRLVVATDDGSLWSIDPDDPGTPAKLLRRVREKATQIAVSASGRSVIAVTGRGGVSIDTATGRMLQHGVPVGTVGVTILQRATAVSVNDPVSGESRLRRLGGFGRGALSFALPQLGRVGASADHRVVFGSHPAGNTLTAWKPSTAGIQTGNVAALAGTIIEAQGLADGRIAVLTDQEVAVVDVIADLRVTIPPSIAALSDPLFVASWVRLEFDLGTSGLTPADVTFAVPEGPDAGIVSYTRDDDAAFPSPILVAGGRLGTYKVVMIETATSTEIAGAEFTVTNEWADAQSGPSMMIAGRSTEFAGDSGWGGGPTVPQNFGDLTHTGTWNVLVMLVDTSTARWPAATLTQSRTDVLDHVISGFNVGGTERSVRLYYDENSANQLTLAVLNNATFGPVSMTGDWKSYFTQTTDAMGVITDARWGPKGTSWQAFLTQAINDGVVTTADLRAVDSVAFIPFSPDATRADGDRYAWPYGDVGKQRMLLGTNVTADQGDVACLHAPLNFAAQDGRQTHSTLSHELGHNLGLLDVYNLDAYPANVTSRITSDWEMMAGSRNSLPHFSVSNKMRMGWVPNGQVKLYNFSGAGGIDENITLHASELDAPPPGRFRGIEIRLGDGWNYYVEYRSEQSGFVSDDLPNDRRVVLTDVVSEDFSPPILRPRILFVPNDPDGDGRILDVGNDFEATDPGTGFDLSVTVVSTDEDNAVVRIQYGSDGRPELGIRPWDNGPTWQSPDIEVRNAKNAADASLANVPWAGRPNTVVAKVKNNGDFDATGVSVEFFVTRFSAGEGPWQSLVGDVRDVAAGATVEFTTNWTPAADESMHYCIIVRIKLYQDPGNPAIVDANIFNNEARSNYSRFISASASPSSRTGTSVMLANPFWERTLVRAKVRQTHALHRAFIDHTWLTVDPDAPRPVQVLDEALFATPEWPFKDDDREGWQKQLWGVPNLVSIEGWARVPRADECISQMPTGGVCLSVQAGRGTETRVLELWQKGIHGTVNFVDDGAEVPDRGKVLVEIAGRKSTWTVTTQTFNGQFRIEFPHTDDERIQWLMAHYLGDFGASPSKSERHDL